MAVSRELPGAQPVIATVREDVVVVLVEHEDRELVVILDRETDWRVPHIEGTPIHGPASMRVLVGWSRLLRTPRG